MAKYYIVAGEASGDLHGSNLMKGLYAEDPGADIRFWGGDLMNAVFKDHQSGEGLVEDYNSGQGLALLFDTLSRIIDNELHHRSKFAGIKNIVTSFFWNDS